MGRRRAFKRAPPRYRALLSTGYSSKEALLVSECGRDDVAQTSTWRVYRQQTHWLVFIDETTITTKMTPLRGRARREAPQGSRSLRPLETQTFIAALHCDDLTARIEPYFAGLPVFRE